MEPLHCELQKNQEFNFYKTPLIDYFYRGTSARAPQHLWYNISAKSVWNMRALSSMPETIPTRIITTEKE